MSAITKKDSNQFAQLIDYAIDIVTKASGNVFTNQHHFLIETKIRKRMMDLEIVDPDEYLTYLKNNESSR